jgi:hypothetical protein
VKYIDISNQAEYDAHKDEADTYLCINAGRIVVASGSASVRASGSASVEASGSASVRASGSASVEAYDSASVEAYGSASVEAYGSASVRAYGSASVRAYDSASVEATPAVPVQQYPGYHGTTTGGVPIVIPDLNEASGAEWAAFYGLKPGNRGWTVIVYKAVNADLVSNHGMKYPLGETVTAPDWKPTRDCGNGLHFSATPRLARSYHGHDSAGRFLACEVAVESMIALGDKIKAPACVVLHEVDIAGKRIDAATTASK